MPETSRSNVGGAPTDLHWGPLESANEEEALGAVLTECFGMKASYWPKYVGVVGRPNFRRFTRHGRVVAGCCFYRLGHFFGGQSVPTGGVAAVGVPPEERAGGIAFHMMARLLRDMRAEGFPLASLFASTQRLYRKVGYEQAGTITEYTMPTHAIGKLPRELEIRRVNALEFDHFRALYTDYARERPGFVDRPEGLWTRQLDAWADGPARVAFLLGPAAAPEGYLVYTSKTDGDDGELIVRDLVARTPRALLTAWSLIADHRSLLRQVRWRGAPVDANLALFPEQRCKTDFVERWMVRVIDVEKALLARGYDPNITARVRLEVTDDVLPENAGSYELSVERGSVKVTKQPGSASAGVPGAILHVRALAPLYTGFLSAAELVQLGWVEADAAGVRALDAVFRGPSPWLMDAF